MTVKFKSGAQTLKAQIRLDDATNNAWLLECMAALDLLGLIFVLQAVRASPDAFPRANRFVS